LHQSGAIQMQTKRPTNPAAEEILGGYFPVLDHGFVSLVDYMGTDEDIERAARVSYGYGTRKVSQTRGLIRYLRRHAHTTPSEMVELKFHCAMPMFVARQWIRHRTASVNEYSGRYSLMPLLFYKPEFEQFALQSEQNNQGRGDQPAERALFDRAVDHWERGRREAADGYRWMVGEDVAREIARIDLPLSTYTQWYWKIDLHNLFHFLTLRADPHAQWEIQEFARIMAGMLKRVAPLSYEAWIDYNVCAGHVTRAEMDALRLLLQEDGGGVRAREGSALSPDQLRELGMSGREVAEFVGKLAPREVPDYELDLSRMRPAEDVAAEMQAAVPGTVPGEED
jgi:thymidylate synthase (FAD)